ncbi:MAG: leucine-rich repeat protein [Prevotella sp.]|nr:leucine-rich repeat protein [Prevotella sp.]
MKKNILSIAAFLFGMLTAFADNISVPDVTVAAGETATVGISLNNTETNIVSFQMDLTLPEGITVNKAGCSLTSRITDEEQELTIGKQGDNVYRLTSTSFALTPISGTSGEIITLSLTATADSEGGTATISNIRLATSSSVKLTLDDVVFNIAIETPSPAIVFADSKVKDICVANWDTNGDGKLSEAEAAAVTDLGEVFKGNTEITSFDELQYFIGLTEIGNAAFNGCTGLISAIIPEGVTTIGESAFLDCTSLTTINIPEGVTSLALRSFDHCHALSSIEIPGSVVSIGGGAFGECYGLTTIIIPEGVTSIGNSAFWDCSHLTSITIPSSLTSIEARAFVACNNLSSVIASDIEAWCNISFENEESNPLNYSHHLFVNGEEIKNLILPNNLSSISDRSFSGCSDLTSVTIPNSVTSIGSSAFEGCSNLTSVRVDIVNPLQIDANTFSNRANATLYVPKGSKSAYEAADYWKDFHIVDIEDPIVFADANVKALCLANWDANGDGELSYVEAASVTDLGVVFTGNTEITSFNELQYFTGLSSIGGSAFEGCQNLSSFIIPNSVATIGERAFLYCWALQSVTIPSSVTVIENTSFHETSLTTVFIPQTVESVGYRAFTGCPYLESIIVENGNPNYDSRNGCNAIVETATNTIIAGCKNSIIPEGILAIGGCAFEQLNDELTTISIPGTVKYIGEYAFSGTTGLTSIVIPEGVEEINGWCFSGCSNLESISLPQEVPISLSEDIYGYDAILCVPIGCREAYENAEYWQNFKAIVEDGDEIQRMGDSWEARYYMAENWEEAVDPVDGNGNLWYSQEFDDSNWSTLTGPMGRNPEANYNWAQESSCVYLRRSFNLDEVKDGFYLFSAR